MINKRVKISNVVENQLPDFVKDTYPLATEFLKSYYRSQDSQGLPADIINSIDQYLKLENNTNLVSKTALRSDIEFSDSTIPVESTTGFPDQYGIIQIDSEIITYTGITTNSFTGCSRGFSGITSYKSSNKPDELVFSSSERDDHTNGSDVKNLSILFLKDFLRKLKKQIAPGFDNRSLAKDLNQRLFLSRSKDFYESKGTSQAYEILFRALYGKDVDLNRPSDYLFIPSDAGYRVTNDLVVEAISGDPELLVNKTLFQDKNLYHNKAFGTITNVEKIFRGDKEYYVISLDADYGRDIDTNFGSVRGSFAIHPKTSLLNNAAIGSTVLDVDSTVGFAQTGQLSALLPNGTTSLLSYTSKSSTQFYGVSGVSQSLGETQEVRQNTVAFGYTSRAQENPVQVRIGAVLSDLVVPNNTSLFEKGDTVEVKSLGKISDDTRTNNWLYNIKVEYDISKVTKQANTIFDLETNDSNILQKGDLVSLTDNTGVSQTISIDTIFSDKRFRVKNIVLDENKIYSLKKLSLKGDSSSYPQVSNFLANVQNTYLDEDDVYVTSNSIPYYSSKIEPENFSVNLTGSFSGEELVIGSHPFYTGDAVQYVGTGLNISSGTYFVKVVNSTTIKLSASKPNIENGRFFTISGSTTDSKILQFGYKGKTLEPQKLIRKLSKPEQRDQEYNTNPGSIGIFVNGVELQNYKSQDVVYSGELENIIVSAEGRNYDIENPPILSIEDRFGSQATGKVSVKGDLKRIEIIDPGVDYLETPTITISGGNGLGAIAESSLINYIHTVRFSANRASNQVDLTLNTISFNEIHKLRDGEKIFYKTSGGTPVGGLDDRSEYYVGVVDAFRVKMYRTLDDASKGVNPIDLTSNGTGAHDVSTVEYRKKVASIRVTDSGKNYENKFRQCTSAGIDTAKNCIKIDNHDYSSGDIITYKTNNTEVLGLSTLSSYYVTKIDDNEFYLSQVGIGTTNKDQYYKSREFVDLRSTGSGVHSFNYEPVSVKINGRIGLSTITTTNSILIDPTTIRSGISTFVAGVGQSSFAFSYTPRPNRNQLIDVFINGVRLSDSDFDSTSGSNIILNNSAAGGEIIEMVSYGSTVRTNDTSVYAGAGQTNFPFIYAPGFLDVYYNGLKLPQRDYISDDGKSVVLKEGAIDGDLIELVTYPEIVKVEKTFTAQNGQTIFPFVHQSEYGLIDVYLNGVRLPTEEYDATSTLEIKLYEATVQGDVVYVSYVYLSEIIGLGEDFNAKIQPIFRGEINTAFVTNRGANYGSRDIVNYNRQPLFTLNSGKNAELIPVINQTTGGIEDVLVRNPGSGYNSAPDLKIIGEGSRAILTPVVKNGRLDRVVVVNPGVKYDPNNTSLIVEAAGLGAKFEAQVQTWNINNFTKVCDKDKISFDEGFLYPGSSSSLKYNHLYTPRKLRELLYGTRQYNGITQLEQDLRLDENSREIESSQFHSPIVGWAYDGSPIYGPYGFESPTGGVIKRMRSSYVPTTSDSNRPSLSSFPQGSFVNDWVYDGSGDLDEHNGRFCVTPEYPDGVYAYFTTISEDVDTIGPFKNYKRPVFPYVIGNSYNSKPNEFNFDVTSTEEYLDLAKTNWFRNTHPYGLISDNTSYQYVFDPNKIRKQTSIVEYAQPGSLTGVDILDGGENYKVGDAIIFASGVGRGASAQVDKVQGKPVNTVSVATSYIEDVEFLSLGINGNYLGICPSPHNLRNADTISIAGLSTYKNDLQKNFRITVKDSRVALGESIDSVAVTGIVTHLNLVNTPGYPTLLEDDILLVGSEEVKVLNIEADKSRIRVLRARNSTVGSSHTSATIVKQKSRRIEFKANYQKSGLTQINRKLYFDPEKTVAIAATWGVGITSTVFLDVLEYKIPATVSVGQSTILLLKNQKDITNFAGGGYVSLVNPTDSAFARKNVEVLAIGTSSITVDFDTSSLSGAGVTVYVNKVESAEIPTRSVYFENHGLETGEKVVYNSNGGSVISVIRDTTPITLTQNSELFVRRINNNVFSLTTSTVDLGTDVNDLQFTGTGTGEYHSFKTVRNDVINGQLERNLVTVATGSSHGLSLKDTVSVDVNVGITTTVKVFYNDRNRRLVVNKRSFTSSDVDTIKDTIRINNHGLYTGQKIILQTDSSSDFTNDELYYVIAFDSNKIRLSKTHFDSRLDLPSFVNITQSFSGSIFQINPQIKYCRNQKVKFDLSDSSLSYISSSGQAFSAFEFNLYTDEKFENLYTTTGDLSEFNVTRNGAIGLDSDASLTFSASSETPETVFYTLKPLPNVPVLVKNQIINDFDKIRSAHSLLKVDSVYSGNYSVVSTSATTFSYVIQSQPEISRYTKNIANLSYESTSKSISGSISSIRITSEGSGYVNVPDISKVNSDNGDFSILSPYSTNVGRIKSTKIEDIGFDYPTDNTLRPSVNLANLLQVERYSSIDSIGISSAGNGYTTPPDLIIIDTVTNNVLDVLLKYELGSTDVKILKNTKDLYDSSPKIIPIHNSNSIGISTVEYDESTKDVTVTLNKSFGTAASFPFNVGDEVMVESVGITTIGKGYNTKDYDYDYFTITSTEPRIGGVNPTVTFNLSNFLKLNEKPGAFDPDNSSGKIVAVKNFPLFTISLQKNEFLIGETIFTQDGIEGVVDKWNKLNDRLKVLSPFGIFNNGTVIEGKTSGTKALIVDSSKVEGSYNIDSSSEVKKGWKRDTGFLNNAFQRLHDSDYYQYFSYELKSAVSLEKWDEPVQTLSHPAGFKKFSNLIMEDSSVVGILTAQDEGDFTSTVDIINVANVNCYSDWDLVTENYKYIIGDLFSDEIIFGSKILQNYFESVTNNVLSIDDISGQFKSDEREDPFSVVDTYPLNQRYKKYITYVKDKRFTNERQLLMVTVLHDDIRGYLNQYGRLETSSDLGSFDFSIRATEGNLDFYPVKYKVNNYDISLVSYNLEDQLVGVGSTGLGSVSEIQTQGITVPVGFADTSIAMATIEKSYKGAKVLVSIATTDARHQYEEISILRNSSDEIAMLEYGQLIDESLSQTSVSGFGTYDAYVPYKLIPTVAAADYFNSSGIETSRGGTGTGPFGGFAIGDYTELTGNGLRQLTLPPEDARNYEFITVNAIVGSDFNGGEQPESTESLHAYYSIDGGSTYVDFGELVPYTGAHSLRNYTLEIPEEARTVNTLFRLRQQQNSGNGFDNFGIKHVIFESDRTYVNFYPNAGIAGTVNTMTVGLALTAGTGIGSMTFNTNTVESIYTGIGSTSSPVANRVAGWSTDVFNGGYLLVGVEDATNNEYELFELLAAQDDLDQSITEFGNLMTSSGIGTIGIACTGVNLDITFTPNANIDANVRVFQHALRLVDNFNTDTGIGFSNGSINSGNGVYRGTELDITRSFNIVHNNKDVFEKYFSPTTDPRKGPTTSTNVVDLETNQISVDDHFFVSGEEITYSYPDVPGFEPIGIAQTTILGITTDRLPSKIYAVRTGKNGVKVAASASEALRVPPSVLDITSTGIGVSHRFTACKQNQKALITIDNLIQSPVVATATTTILNKVVTTFDDSIIMKDITKFRSGDIIKVDEEIMRIDSINSSTNKVNVRRNWMGTNIGIHSLSTKVQLMRGNYNIVGNKLNFIDAPLGLSPIGSTTNPPDERDFTGISTSSVFSGRVFTRTGTIGDIQDPYHKNYLFDDLSDSFTGVTTEFTLTSSTPLDGQVFDITSESITFNGATWPVRGKLYVPNTPSLDSDVVVFYHGDIDDSSTTVLESAQNLFAYAKDTLLLKDKIILSAAYPLDDIPQANSLDGTIGGIENASFLYEDNLNYARASLRWAKSTLNTYLTGNGINKIVDKVYMFGHTQGGALVHKLNRLERTDGAIISAVNQIRLDLSCRAEETSGLVGTGKTISDANATCQKLFEEFGSAFNTAEYFNRSVQGYTTGLLAPVLYIQGQQDTTTNSDQVNLVDTLYSTLQGQGNPTTTLLRVTGGQNAYITNTDVHEEIRNFVKSDGASNIFKSDITGISTDNAIVVLNGIFQSPSRFGTNPIVNDYHITENNGISTISFTSAPIGGKIVSVASTSTLGYQPLVSAGGSAIVSGLGTIQSISIGNSGSGYRPGIQTHVSVSVASSSISNPVIEKVGVASISNGIVVSIDITNPGSGYTSSNPPRVIIDDPFPYADLELNYANGTSGLGTGARVSVVVGQGSSIIDFELTNTGSGYELGDVLTVSIGGTTGLATNTTYNFQQFELTVDDQYQEQFNGWSVGNLTLFDKVDKLFNGFDRSFPLMIDGERQSIKARDGSGIDIGMTLLVFLNGVLQEPGVAYKFDGGSTLTFTQPPVEGEDSTILFYQGNKDVDVIFRDILETVKVGDNLQIVSDTVPDQDKRTVFSIDSTDVVTTNTYGGQGIVTTGLVRPVEWCKQTSDKFINGGYVAKDREEYEYLIYPSTNIIKTIESSDSIIFVENTSTIFDSINENPTPIGTRRDITIIDQDTLVSAAATATINGSGSVTSFTVTNSGVGYTQAPTVTIENPTGMGTDSRATATATVSGGKVTSISVSSGGSDYTKAPVVLIEPPRVKYETIDNVSYSGDFGIIGGISTTSVGVASTGIVFDLYIPENSYLKDSAIVSTAATISAIETGYYFTVSGTNVGSGVTSLNSSGSVITNGTDYLDNVYEAVAVSIAQTSVPGVGVTDVARVTVSVSDYNNLDISSVERVHGKYSWGRISASRNSSNSYEIYNNGLSGITTSPIVRRVNPLENSNYLQ